MPTVVELSTPALLREKQEKLFTVLRGFDRVMVAYSGGADSAYLAWAAHQVLGDRAVAITADSASMPESHKRDAERFVWQFGIPHEYVKTHEFDNPDYLKNDANRCASLRSMTKSREKAWSVACPVICLAVWGRFPTCGRFPIGPIEQADWKSAAG